MDIHEMLNDVCRARTDLAALAVDESVSPDRFAECEVAASNLESAVTDLLTTAWIPKNSTEIAACIVCINRNLERVQSDIDDCICDVIVRDLPDEYYRVWAALAFSRLLDFQMQTMMDVLANILANAPSSFVN